MWRGQMIVSLRPQVVFAIALSPFLGRQLSGQVMLGGADLVQQFVECFGRKTLAGGERAKHIHQQKTHAKNLRQRSMMARRAAQLGQDHVAYPLPPRKSLRLRELSHRSTLLFREL